MRKPSTVSSSDQGLKSTRSTITARPRAALARVSSCHFSKGGMASQVTAHRSRSPSSASISRRAHRPPGSLEKIVFIVRPVASSSRQCRRTPGALSRIHIENPRNKKPRQAGLAGVDGGLDALAVGFGGGSWMSLQPGSNRLLPLGTDLRFAASSAYACRLTDNCRLLPLPSRIKTQGSTWPCRFSITPQRTIRRHQKHVLAHERWQPTDKRSFAARRPGEPENTRPSASKDHKGRLGGHFLIPKSSFELTLKH